MPRQRVQQQYPQYAGNPMIMNMIEPQVGQQLVQQQILLDEAEKLGIHVTDADVRSYLQTGPPGQVSVPEREVHRPGQVRRPDSEPVRHHGGRL